MASAIAMMVRSAAVNASAFIGGGVIARMLSSSDEERVSHDKALERLTEAMDRLNKERVEGIDMINRTLRGEGRKRGATNDFIEYEGVMKEYYQVTGVRLPEVKEPKLSDYYVPSEEQKI